MKWTCFFLLMAPLTCTLNAQSLIVKEKKGQYGFFIKNKKVVDYQYDAVVQLIDGSYAVNRNDRWGLVSPEGRETIPCRYETIAYNSQEGYLVGLDGRYGIVSKSGQMLLPFEYEAIGSYYQDSLTLVKKDGTWRYLSNGKISDTVNGPIIYESVEKRALFTLCPETENLEFEAKLSCADRRMLEFIYRKINYPAAARKKGTQGDVVISFLISDTGKIVAPMIVQNIGDGCGEESLKIIQSMPHWIPASQKGKPVWTEFTIPVKFRLE